MIEPRCLASPHRPGGANLERVVLAQPPRRESRHVDDREPAIGRRHPVQDRAGAVRRPVIDHHQLEVGIVLGEHRGDRRLDVRRLVPRGHDD